MSPPKNEFNEKDLASWSVGHAGDTTQTDPETTKARSAVQDKAVRSFDTSFDKPRDLARDSDKYIDLYCEQPSEDWESISQLLHNDVDLNSPTGFNSSSATIYASMYSTESHPGKPLSTKTAEAPQIEHSKAKRTTQMTEADEISDITEQDGRPVKQSRRECSQAIGMVKLACPYRQNDPKTYNTMSEKVCGRSYWPSAARIKQVISVQIIETGD
jgi:hypothetical protein